MATWEASAQPANDFDSRTSLAYRKVRKMTSRVTTCGCALAMVLLVPLLAQGQSGRSAGTNAPPTSAGSSAPAASKDRLQDLEDQLSKALESFSPKGMLEAKPEPQMPPPQVIVPNSRVKSEQEKRKNWMFLEPDDLLQGKSGPEWLNPSATSGEKKKNDLDLFYERLNRERSLLNQKGHLNPDDLSPLSGSARLEDSPFSKDEKLPDGLKGPANKLRDLLGPGQSVPSPPHSFLSDFLSPSQNTLTPEQVQAHKDLMEEYRKVIVGWTPATTPLNSPAGAGAPVMSSLPGGLPASQPVTPGMVGSIFNPSLVSDRNATVLNQWNPLYAPPKTELPKAPVVVDPPLEAPRRKF